MRQIWTHRLTYHHFALGAALAAAAFSSPVMAQDLWSGTRTGQTPAEVQAAVDGTEATQGGALDGGERPLLIRRGIALGGSEFEARFYFSDNALKAVILRPSDTVSAVAVEDLFRRLQPALTERYGAPYDCQSNVYQSWQSYRCLWRSGDTAVSINLYPGSEPPLQIGYRTRVWDSEGL